MASSGPKDPRAPDTPMAEVDTGKISSRLHAQMAGELGQAPTMTPPMGVPTPEAFLDALALKLAARVNRGPGGGEPPARRFLGLEAGGWTKLLASMLLAAAVGLITWWATVRDELRIRPTTDEVGAQITEAEAHHAKNSEAHPPIQARIVEMEGEQRTIRESQIRQEVVERAQAKTLEEIAEDVKTLRRRGR